MVAQNASEGNRLPPDTPSETLPPMPTESAALRRLAERIVDALSNWSKHPDEHDPASRADSMWIKERYRALKGVCGIEEASRTAEREFVERVLASEFKHPTLHQEQGRGIS